MKRTANAIVECGDFSWIGIASSFDDAIKKAFKRTIPKEPSLLARVSVNGGYPARGGKRRGMWHYIGFDSALKIAGYKLKKTKNGFSVHN